MFTILAVVAGVITYRLTAKLDLAAEWTKINKAYGDAKIWPTEETKNDQA